MAATPFMMQNNNENENKETSGDKLGSAGERTLEFGRSSIEVVDEPKIKTDTEKDGGATEGIGTRRDT